MAGKKARLEESPAALRELMTEPAPSPSLRTAILTRRRMVRALLEDRRDQLELDALGSFDRILVG